MCSVSNASGPLLGHATRGSPILPIDGGEHDAQGRREHQRASQTAKRAKEEITGPLRIVGPRSAFQSVLWRLLEEFCRQYPGIVPDVQLEDRVG